MARRYLVTVRGHVGAGVLELLEVLEIVDESADRSTYVVELIDQADLYGVLTLLQGRGIELVSVVETRDEQ